MTTPAKSFDDLRTILGKLDRKIDNARSKRLGLDDEPDGPSTNAEPDRVTQNGETSKPADPADETVGEGGRSPFGRAKPLNRNGSSSGTWIGGAGIG